ncbi:hypothetical protein RF11_03180 [Thelohanellus kitauei]|uniref:Uncharacterized protein n=1 Tax=Thelohanellus kitauei TaxID=669202 RepID=A0A0C2INI0_THEKT|nr:hypothetical protein RF11_03180 [Thelohanellus kitauei]
MIQNKIDKSYFKKLIQPESQAFNNTNLSNFPIKSGHYQKTYTQLTLNFDKSRKRQNSISDYFKGSQLKKIKTFDNSSFRPKDKEIQFFNIERYIGGVSPYFSEKTAPEIWKSNSSCSVRISQNNRYFK